MIEFSSYSNDAFVFGSYHCYHHVFISSLTHLNIWFIPEAHPKWRLNIFPLGVLPQVFEAPFPFAQAALFGFNVCLCFPSTLATTSSPATAIWMNCSSSAKKAAGPIAGIQSVWRVWRPLPQGNPKKKQSPPVMCFHLRGRRLTSQSCYIFAQALQGTSPSLNLWDDSSLRLAPDFACERPYVSYLPKQQKAFLLHPNLLMCQNHEFWTERNVFKPVRTPSTQKSVSAASAAFPTRSPPSPPSAASGRLHLPGATSRAVDRLGWVCDESRFEGWRGAQK